MVLGVNVKNVIWYNFLREERVACVYSTSNDSFANNLFSDKLCSMYRSENVFVMPYNISLWLYNLTNSVFPKAF